MKIQFKENNTVTKIKYKSFLYVKIPLMIVLYAIVISAVASFGLDSVSDLLSFKGIVMIAIFSFLGYNTLNNYTYFKDLKEKMSAHENEGIQTYITLYDVEIIDNVSKITGALKNEYEYTFIWQDRVYPGIKNEVNDNLIGPKLKEYLLTNNGIDIPGKIVNDTIYIDPNLIEKYLNKKTS